MDLALATELVDDAMAVLSAAERPIVMAGEGAYRSGAWVELVACGRPACFNVEIELADMPPESIALSQYE